MFDKKQFNCEVKEDGSMECHTLTKKVVFPSVTYSPPPASAPVPLRELLRDIFLVSLRKLGVRK